PREVSSSLGFCRSFTRLFILCYNNGVKICPSCIDIMKYENSMLSLKEIKMSEIEKLLEDIFINQKLISAVLSNLRRKNESSYTKVDIKPVIIKNQLKYQFVFNYTNKVLHKNLDINEAIKETVSLIESTFKQAM